jgi:gamma-glutamyltranspeptidase
MASTTNRSRRGGARCAIASPQRTATEAGVAAFEAGGNAIDAALAAAAVLSVSYPDNCSIGGDLIALIARPGEAPLVVNSSGPAPRGLSADSLRSHHGRMPVSGPATVTVPGAIAGLHALWDLGAARPWEAVFDVAVQQAEHGFEIVPSLAASIASQATRLAGDEGTAAVFLPGGTPLPAGATLRQPALAASLRLLAERGPDAFYRGPLGASAVARLAQLGCALDEDDLSAFSPELTAPLRIVVDGDEILTAPPNSQGFLLPQMLRAAELLGVDPDPLGATAGTLALLASNALRERDRQLCDPRSHEVPLDRLFEPAYLRALASSPAEPAAGPAAARGDTVAVVTADSDGNAVTLIQSVFEAFGAAILDPATGILFHNRGALFSLEPDSVNVLAGGKRPAHTLMPCMVQRDGRLRTVIGTMGGNAQPQILAQVLLHLRHGATVQDAVGAPRWVVGVLEDDRDRHRLLAEPGVGEAARQSLAEVGLPLHDLPAQDRNVGHTQLIGLSPDGAMSAASDPRSEGSAAVATR